MISSKTIRKIINTTFSKPILKNFQNSNGVLFVVSIATLVIGYGYVIKNTPEKPFAKTKTDMQMNPARAGATVETQELSSLLVTKNQSPEMVKCNFSGTYRVTQDHVRSQNGAKCDEFEPRTLRFNNVIGECTRFLDPNQELFLTCKNPNNPVTECDGIVFVNVSGKRACEYWVTIQRDY